MDYAGVEKSEAFEVGFCSISVRTLWLYGIKAVPFSFFFHPVLLKTQVKHTSLCWSSLIGSDFYLEPAQHNMILMGRKDSTVPQHHISLTRGILPGECGALSPCSQHLHPWGWWERPGGKPISKRSFPAFSSGLEEICDSSPKVTAFPVKCSQCWWEVLLWHWIPHGCLHKAQCTGGSAGQGTRASFTPQPCCQALTGN